MSIHLRRLIDRFRVTSVTGSSWPIGDIAMNSCQSNKLAIIYVVVAHTH